MCLCDTMYCTVYLILPRHNATTSTGQHDVVILNDLKNEYHNFILYFKNKGMEKLQYIYLLLFLKILYLKY